MNQQFEIAKKIKTFGILSILFTLTLILGIVATVLSIINIVNIASTDWKNEELNQSKKTFWILSLVLLILLTPIASGIVSIVWAGKVNNN